MSKNLYNREFVINDAIVAAHPHAGTTIVDIDSPSGGEGRVLDAIERQALTIKRLVHPNKIIHRLAQLATELDDAGFVESSFTIMKMADEYGGPNDMSLVDDNDMSFVDDAESEENKDISELSEQEKYKKVFTVVLQHLNLLSDTLAKFVTEARKVPDANKKEIKSIEEDFAEIHRGYSNLMREFIQTGNFNLIERIGTSFFSKTSVAPRTVLSEIYKFFSDELPQRLSSIRKSNTNFKIIEDSKYGKNLLGLLNQAKKYGVQLKAISKIFDGPGGGRNRMIDTTYNVIFSQEQTEEGAQAKTEKTDKLDLSNTRKVPSITPEATTNQVEPEDIFVEALQEFLKVQITRKYDNDTHRALGRFLLDRSKQGDDDGKRAKILLDDYYYNKTASEMTANAKPIFEALTGQWDPLTPKSEVKATPKIRYIDFVSPTGGLISGFPIGSVLKEVQKNPYTFIKRLSMAGAIEGDDQFANKNDYNRYLESVINHDTYLPQIVRSMLDSLKVAGLPDNLLLVVKELMDDTIVSLRDSVVAEDEKNDKMHIMRYLESISHTLAQKLATSPVAVKRYVDKLIALDVVDSAGYISARRGLSQKATIIEQAKFYIKEYNLTGAARVYVDDTAHKFHTTNINTAQRIAMTIVEEMISSKDPTGVWERKSKDPTVIANLEAIGYDTSNGNIRFKNYLSQLYKWRIEEAKSVKTLEQSQDQAPEPSQTTPSPSSEGSYSAGGSPANVRGTQVGK